MYDSRQQNEVNGTFMIPIVLIKYTVILLMKRLNSNFNVKTLGYKNHWRIKMACGRIIGTDILLRPLTVHLYGGASILS